MKNSIKTILLILIIGISFFIYYQQPSTLYKKIDKENEIVSKDEFFIYFIDIDEGDSMIISNNHEYILIDTGRYDFKDKLLNTIDKLGIKKFKYVIGTHAHEDHIGTMPTIIRNYELDHYLMPDVSVNNKSYELTIKELKKKNMIIETPKIGEIYHLNNTKIKILSIDNNKEKINDTSIVLKIIYQNTTFLLTGDATKEVELKLLEKDIKSDVLKVSHHGSKDASSAQFLSKVKPEYAIISVGKDNEYYHPHQVTLDKLEQIGSKIYRTDQMGDIIVYSNGNTIEIETEKQS